MNMKILKIKIKIRLGKRKENENYYKQESCAIAKMTTQCALHMGALKIFGTPYTSTATIPNIFICFCSGRP